MSGIYKPFQHKVRPIGYEHDTIFANMELWADDPPDIIVLGDLEYMLKNKHRKQHDKIVDTHKTMLYNANNAKGKTSKREATDMTVRIAYKDDGTTIVMCKGEVLYEGTEDRLENILRREKDFLDRIDSMPKNGGEL